MKITAGIGNIKDYIKMAEAGADEVFLGFVPYSWNKKYKNLFPLNRREVLYCGLQISSYEDMKILQKMYRKYKVPVSITFNYLYYLKEQYEEIKEIITNLINIGFNRFIIADPALILYLEKENIKCCIHLSGECAEINRYSLDFFKRAENIKRIIFHRKNTIEDIKSCIQHIKNSGRKMEYESFMLNENCHFTGAYCSSFHCDELEHICRLPYKIKDVKNVDGEDYIKYDCTYKDLKESLKKHLNQNINIQEEENSESRFKEIQQEKDLKKHKLNAENYDYGLKIIKETNLNNNLEKNIYKEENKKLFLEIKKISEKILDENEEGLIFGESGCGICALYELCNAGITHLKVVGRGNSADIIENDIKVLKELINFIEKHKTDSQAWNILISYLKRACRKSCYYP